MSLALLLLPLKVKTSSQRIVSMVYFDLAASSLSFRLLPDLIQHLPTDSSLEESKRAREAGKDGREESMESCLGDCWNLLRYLDKHVVPLRLAIVRFRSDRRMSEGIISQSSITGGPKPIASSPLHVRLPCCPPCLCSSHAKTEARRIDRFLQLACNFSSQAPSTPALL